MTLWFCDRCGKQVTRNSSGAGNYNIQKTFYDTEDFGVAKRVQRNLKFCDNCAMELEKFLDDEFAGMPVTLSGEADRRH